MTEARRLLDERRGTMLLTHNPNPALTNGVPGSRRPSEWVATFDSDRWRIFPDAHFSHSVMHGGMINLGVNYAARHDALADVHPRVFECVVGSRQQVCALESYPRPAETARQLDLLLYALGTGSGEARHTTGSDRVT